MTDNRKGLFSNRTSTREFLSYKTDITAKTDLSDDISPSTMTDLERIFPDILFGEDLMTQALESLKDAPAFGSMAIRIDNEGGSGEKPLADDTATRPDNAAVRIDVLKTITTLCNTEKGIWGLIGENVFGAFFPDLHGRGCLDLAKNLQQLLSSVRSETITIGVAAYPALDYERHPILENARKALDHAAFLGPNSAVTFDSVSLNISGDAFYQEGDIQGAIDEYQRALEIDPSNVNVHNSLGVCYGVLKSFDKASASFESALHLDAGEIMALYNTGLVHMMTGHRDKALEYFHSALDIRQDTFEVAYQMGKCYLELEQFGKAKEFLDKAIRLKPDSPPALSCFGQYYTAMNKQEEAIEAFQAAIKKNPNDAKALSGLGYLYDLRNENAEIALIFCKQSVDLAPENGLFHQRLGQLYLKQSLPDKAIKAFRTATDLGCDSTKLIEKIRQRLDSGASH